MEGSGANAKYYAQLGADTASKKRLGSGIDKDYLESLNLNFAVSSLGGYATLPATSGKTYLVFVVNVSVFPTLQSGGTVLFSKAHNENSQGGYRVCLYLIKATASTLKFAATPSQNLDHNCFLYVAID